MTTNNKNQKAKKSKAPRLRFKRDKSGTIAILTGALTARQALTLSAPEASAILSSDKLAPESVDAGRARVDSLIGSTLASRRFSVTVNGVNVSAKNVTSSRNAAVAREVTRRSEAHETPMTPADKQSCIDRADQSMFRAALKTEATLATHGALRAAARQIGVDIATAASDPDTTRDALRSLRSAHRAARQTG